MELINVVSRLIGATQVSTVSAHEMYLGLGLNKSEWSRWSARNIESDTFFLENRDWLGFGVTTNGNDTKDYAISIEFAKHLVMMARTIKAFEYRNYFIECERATKESTPAFNIPTTLSGALRLAAEQAETIEQQAKQIEAAKPSIEFVGRYVESTGSKGFRQVCKLLQANESDFREFLLDKKIMYRLGGEWMPYADHLDAGRFEVKAGTSEVSNHAFNQAKFTTKGINWVAGEWAKYRLLQQAA